MKNNTFTPFLRSYQNNLFLCLIFILFSIIPLNTALANATHNEGDTLVYPQERFSVFFGGFLTSLNNDMILGSKQAGLGVAINLEDALGLKSNSLVLRGEAEYNFGKRRRSAARLGYFGIFRDATKVIDSEIEIGDEIFPVGTELSSKSDIQIFKGTYDYAFFMDKRIRLGASVGVFVMPIKFTTSSSSGKDEVKTDITAPLPVLGISTDFAITPKIHFKQSIEFLYLQFTNFKGVVTDLNLRVEYNPWNHFGFGLGVDAYDLNISLTSESNVNLDLIGSVETSFTGLLFYGRYYF